MRAVPTDGMLQCLMKLLPSFFPLTYSESSLETGRRKHKENWKCCTNPLVKDLSKCEGRFSFRWSWSLHKIKMKKKKIQNEIWKWILFNIQQAHAWSTFRHISLKQHVKSYVEQKSFLVYILLDIAILSH